MLVVINNNNDFIVVFYDLLLVGVDFIEWCLDEVFLCKVELGILKEFIMVYIEFFLDIDVLEVV